MIWKVGKGTPNTGNTVDTPHVYFAVSFLFSIKKKKSHRPIVYQSPCNPVMAVTVSAVEAQQSHNSEEGNLPLCLRELGSQGGSKLLMFPMSLSCSLSLFLSPSVLLPLWSRCQHSPKRTQQSRATNSPTPNSHTIKQVTLIF